MKKVLTLCFLTLPLLGAGCVAPEVSNLSPEQASESLALSVGYEITARATVLGLGGTVVDWLGGEQEERLISIDDWVAGNHVTLSWTVTTDVETQESIDAREAYNQEYASSPVGTEIPDEPEPVYEKQTIDGTIASSSLADSTTLSLPDTWPEGDAGEVGASLIWLSRAGYDELSSTRKTQLSLGLFDESLMKAEQVKGRLVSIMDSFTGLLASLTGKEKAGSEPVEQVDENSLTMIEADPSWGEYTLLVDGVETTVRIIEARNAFASYKILANSENPLILEIQLTPLSQGNIELLSGDILAKGFAGYEITEIKTGN